MDWSKLSKGLRAMGGSILNFLNSAFCVTLLGGVLAAGVTTLWQSKAAHNAYQRAVLEHELQDRRSAAKEFADNFGGALYFWNVLLTRGLWIQAHHGEATHIYPDGRDYVAERTYFETIETRVFSHTTPEGMAARVAMTFSSPQVQSSIRKLAKLLDKMVFDTDEKTLQTDFEAANRYSDVIADMKTEIASFESRWETAK
jgi:hypothetical protein